MSKVAKATIGLMVITLISKALGFGRDLVLSAFYGATMYSDVYLVSLDISRLVFQVIGTAISTTYIPLFFDNIKEGGEEQGNYFTNNVLNITISIGIVISIFAFIFAKPLAKIFASGFNEQALKLTVQFTRIILFGTIFSGLSKIMQSYLQSKGEYYISGMIGFPFNIIIIASIVLSKYFGLYILPIGAVLALASQFFFQIPRSKKRGYKYSLVYNPKDRYIKEMMMLTMPVMIGVGASQINTMVDRTLASQLAVGSISAMKYADRLNTFVLGLFISSITIVIYPMLSKLKSEKQYEKFNEYIKTSINVVILMILPITAIAIVLAEPIVVLLFERGAFDSAATQMTSAALAFYSIGLIGLSLKNVIANVFYSMQDTKTPMYNGVIAVVINNNITKQQQEQEQAEARNEYLQNVVLYEGTLIIAGSNLEDIADTTQTYWHENIFENKHGADINEAILNAFDDKSSEIAAAKEYNDDIKNLYTELKDIPEGSEDLSDLLNIISDTYNSYTDFYDLAIYPEGNYNQYSENNNQRTNDFLDSYRELENYIETDKEFTNLEKTYK